MNSKMKSIIAGIGLASVTILASCSTRLATMNYSGDGSIRVRSGGAVIGGGGYEVKFKQFKLDRPNHLTYHFTGLPKTDSKFKVDFAIEGQQNWVDRKYFNQCKGNPPFLLHYPKMIIDDLQGSMTIALRDSKGHVLFNIHHKLSEYGWHSNSEGLSWLYDKKWKMAFTPENGTEYILEVDIKPDAILRTNDGYVRLQGGGHEGWAIGF